MADSFPFKRDDGLGNPDAWCFKHGWVNRFYQKVGRYWQVPSRPKT